MCLVQLRRGWSESDGVSVTFPTSLLQLTDDEQSQLVNVAVRRLRSLDLPCPVILTPRRQYHPVVSVFLTIAKLECGPMPNLMVALPNIGGALCSTPQSLADAHY